uniref:Bromo domain-containing protein n=1 Tax=Davidia involucrata TaxID=16924 RepID=A0A5B7BPA4_DAVIN
MKRKRGNGKRKPKKPPVMGANEAFLTTDHFGLDDFDNAQFDSRMEAEIPQTDKSSQQAGIEKLGVVNVRAEDSMNSSPEMNMAVVGNLSKAAGRRTTRLSRGVGSSNINMSINMVLAQLERTHQKEAKLPHQDPQYKEQELNAALVVIKKVMKMDAAEPFNVPVDPIALGIPDYFDIIDTPMDFGTICSSLENGVKYLNSKDVFKDVQYIWENCCKYNKKGHYILELMKQVKKNFTKYWTAAGLYSEQPHGINGHLHLSPTEATMRCSTHGHSSSVGPVTDTPSHQQQNQTGLSQLQLHQPSPNYSQPCQPQQNPCQCQTSSGQPQPQAGTNIDTAGPPPMESFTKRVTRSRRCSVGPVTNTPSHQHQDQTDLSQLQPHQPSPSYCQPSQPQQRPCQCQPSSGKPQPLHPQAGINIGSAGHMYLPPPTESTMRCSKRGPRCTVGSMTDNPSHHQQDQIGPSELQSHQPSASFIHPYQPQQRPYQGQLSPLQPQAGTDTESSNTRKRTRGRGPTRCLELWNREGKCISIATNELGQPIGPEAPKLTNFLGTIARNGHIAPLTYVHWRALPDANKENMWQQVQSKFDIDPKSKSWILKSIGKKWKDWKAKLKAYRYNTHLTDEERMADRDERVLPDQWRILILFWNSEEAKERSVKNKANRAQQKMGHTTGTKSFARLREEERVKSPDGKEPSRAELFILTRTRKNGRPVDQASSVVISQLRERAAELQEASQNSAAQDDIFSQVMGHDRHGRVRTYGLGPSPSDLGGPKPSHDEALKMVSEANAEVREMKEQMKVMEQTCSQMAAQMSTMMSMMSTMQRRFADENQPDIVANIPSSSEGSPQVQVHSSSIGHGVPSHERHAIKRQTMRNTGMSGVHAMKRRKMQNTSMSGVARK